MEYPPHLSRPCCGPAGRRYCTSRGATETPKRHTALSLVGKPKQSEGFKNFDWVNPDAPKGGRVRMSAIGTFDSFNPFSTQGVPGGRPDLTQATLMASASADEDSTVYSHIADWVSYPEDYGSVDLRAAQRCPLLGRQARHRGRCDLLADGAEVRAPRLQ